MALFLTPISTSSQSTVEVTQPPVEITKEEVHVKTVDIQPNTLCNCYKSAEMYTGINLPPMAEILPNTDAPVVGDIAIMFYGTVKHVAVVTGISSSTIDIWEGNYNHCEETKRTISKSYTRLVGFFTPQTK